MLSGEALPCTMRESTSPAVRTFPPALESLVAWLFISLARGFREGCLAAKTHVSLLSLRFPFKRIGKEEKAPTRHN